MCRKNINKKSVGLLLEVASLVKTPNEFYVYNLDSKATSKVLALLHEANTDNYIQCIPRVFTIIGSSLRILDAPIMSTYVPSFGDDW